MSVLRDAGDAAKGDQKGRRGGTKGRSADSISLSPPHPNLTPPLSSQGDFRQGNFNAAVSVLRDAGDAAKGDRKAGDGD